MISAKFITHPGYSERSYENPWQNMKFNSYEMELPRGEGLLTLKRFFTPDPSRTVRSVRVRATALGIFDMFVNGIRVGIEEDGGITADEYKPGWTDYRCRVFEYEYDVTSLCGENNLFVAEVSPGWWSGRISFGFYGFRPCAFAGEIEITYDDGGSEIIASDADGSWESTVCGPVMTADIWNGEYYDARVPEPSIHPEAHEWSAAVLYEGFEGVIVPLEGPAIRPKHELTRRPISAVVHSGTVEDGSPLGRIKVVSKRTGEECERTVLHAGEAMILDMGQNMVGRPVIFLRAKRGTKVSGYFAEMLNDSGDPARGNDGPRGSMYIKNYRSAMARVVYVAAGTDDELYFPTHAFFGFRYFELRADRDVEILAVIGEVIGSELKETGEFECDDPEINQLFSNIQWGMRGNYLSVPTDCPQRDERLGWTGDTQIFSGAASYLADIRGFMHKWLGDARDSQQGYDGAYCDVIPRVFPGNNGNAAWGDAGLVVPYRLWLMYGDTEIIRRHYDSMQYYMHYLEQYGLEGPNIAYGDWLNYDVTDKRYIAVCYYAYDAALMEKFSRILGKESEAEYYRLLRERIVAHWRERYVVDGELTVKTQTGYLLALAFDLADGELRERFIGRLRDAIVSNNYTLSTGFVGTGILNQTLAKVGLDGLCYSLLLQSADPSWLYSVRQGATTVWERWNSYTLAKGFGDVGMNSFNHYAYGAVAEWMFSGMCGIMPDETNPGFERFILRPTPDMRSAGEIPAGQERIKQASAAYDSVCGRIESGWSLVNGKYIYRFLIPEGTAARLEIPVQAAVEDPALRLNGLEYTAGELGGGVENGRVVFELTAGSYTVEM